MYLICPVNQLCYTFRNTKMVKESKNKAKAMMEAVDKMYDQVPAFEDVFTETGFYIFAGVFTILTVLAALAASKYINLKDRDKTS